MGILLPPVGQTHLDLTKRKENRHMPRVKAERATTVTGNGKAQIFQQGTLSKPHPLYTTNHLLKSRPSNGGTKKR
jgi:hypothetical protein